MLVTEGGGEVSRCMLTGLVPVRLLDTTGRWCGLASGLGGELLTGSLATGGLACESVLVVVRWKGKVRTRQSGV